METRARFVLIGTLTVVTLLATLGFILWLAKVQIDRTYAQYDILFDTVAGLGQSSAVRYNGVDVGKVLTIALDRADPALVRVRIEIFASTPVRVDTLATLAGQGVTGVSVVALEGGSAGADRLVAIPPADVPVIPSKPSVVAGLLGDAPDLLAEAISLMKDLGTFTTPENREAVAGILSNLNDTTARLDALSDRAEAVMTQAEVTLSQVNATFADAQTTFASANTVIRDDVPGLVDSAKALMSRAAGSVGAIQNFAENGLPQFSALAADARALVANIGGVTDRIGSDPGRFFLGDQTPDYRN